MKFSIRVLFVLVFFVFLIASYWLYPYKFAYVWKLFDNDGLPSIPLVLDSGVDLRENLEIHKQLTFESYDYYEIGLLFEEGSAPSAQQSAKKAFSLKGEIDVKLICDDIELIDKVIRKPIYYKFADNDIYTYKALVLTKFPLLRGTKGKDCKLNLEVLTLDSPSKNYKVDFYYSKHLHL